MNKPTLAKPSGYLITDFFKARHLRNVRQFNSENHSPEAEVALDLARFANFSFSLEDQIKSSFPGYIIRVMGLEKMLRFSPVTIHMIATPDDNDMPEIVLYTDDLTADCQFDWDLQNRPYIYFKYSDPQSGDAGVLIFTCQQNTEWSYCWVKRPCIVTPFGFQDNHIPLANSLIDPEISSEGKERILKMLLSPSENTCDASHPSPKMY